VGKNVNLVSARFGRLLVRSLAFTKERGRKVWACVCDCGNTTTATTETLNAGTKKSCGCLHRETAAAINKTHGASGGKTYRIWCGINARCKTASATGFSRYGGRGLKVCRRWQKYENFLQDMGECPKGKSIERKNNNGGYTKTNCYWATPAQQSRNTCRTRFVMVRGTKKVARDAAVKNGVSVSAFKARLYKYGWSVEQACGLLPKPRR
jgi:hypothetical protein